MSRSDIRTGGGDPMMPLFALARRSDPATSRDAAEALEVARRVYRQLLDAFGSAGDAGLTDEEAIARAGLDSSGGWWKRCSELRGLGLIEPTGEVRRSPTTGRGRMVCRVTSGRVPATGEGIHPDGC